MNALRLLACAVLATCVASVASAQPRQDERDYGGIEPKVVAAWKKAGAGFGWFETKRGSSYSGKARPKEPGYVPGFELSSWSKKDDGKFADLPAPGVPFVLKTLNWNDEDLARATHLGQMQV